MCLKVFFVARMSRGGPNKQLSPACFTNLNNFLCSHFVFWFLVQMRLFLYMCVFLSLSVSLCVCVCIYIYTCTYTYKYLICIFLGFHQLEYNNYIIIHLHCGVININSININKILLIFIFPLSSPKESSLSLPISILDNIFSVQTRYTV